MNEPSERGHLVPQPRRPRGLRSRVIPAGSTWWNVTHRTFAANIFNPSGAGDARFSPLFDSDGKPVPALYVARHPVAAMLETVFHDVWGHRARRVSGADLRGRVLRELRFDVDVRVVDFADGELDRHGLNRAQIVSTSAEHYEQTRLWAALLAGSTIGGHPTTGLNWQSRMIELASAATSPLMQTLLVGEQTDVAVLYEMPDGVGAGDVSILSARPLDTRDGRELVTELAVALGGFVDA